MTNINQLIATATKSGFESYGNFRTEDNDIQCEILTCMKGEFSGENIELNYQYNTGEVVKIDQYCQFQVNHPHYSPVKFSFK